jgi:hypothetical protein
MCRRSLICGLELGKLLGRKDAQTMGRLGWLVEQKQNREIPTWISTGLAVAIAGLWTALAYFSTPPLTPDSRRNFEASCNSLGVRGDVNDATSTPSNTGSCPQAKP